MGVGRFLCGYIKLKYPSKKNIRIMFIIQMLQLLQAFGRLKTVKSSAGQDANLQCVLMRSCFKAGVNLRPAVLALDEEYDTTNLEESLMEFSFGACNEQHATQERFMELELSRALNNTFMQRWIEVILWRKLIPFFPYNNQFL